MNSILKITIHHQTLIPITIFSLCLITLAIIFFTANRKVYLLDFACYKGKEFQKMTKKNTIQQLKLYFNLTEDSVPFMQQLLGRAGLGESTYFPEALARKPPNPCMEEVRNEAEDVMFEAIDKVLKKTGVNCKNIKIVVVNCSLFSVVPSLSDMIVNRYGLEDDVLSYSLGGMGCSAGLSAIGFAKQLLQVHQNTFALVVSTENITQNCYMGHNRSMSLVNSIFRVGGAAILLTNRTSDRRVSKYQLLHTVHTNAANDNLSYNCIYQEEDQDGIVGVTITKDLMIVAIKAIESNLMALGRLVLPVPEQIRFLTNYLTRHLFQLTKTDPYVPNFKDVFRHFFPHVGGTPVLDELQRNLGFSESQMEASRMTLNRFGNTSSSSVWYELAYAEAKGVIRRGDRVWQIAFGAGFKCDSAVWQALRTVDFDEMNPWSDEIDAFPVDVSNMGVVPYYFEPSKIKCA